MAVTLQEILGSPVAIETAMQVVAAQIRDQSRFVEKVARWAEKEAILQIESVAPDVIVEG